MGGGLLTAVVVEEYLETKVLRSVGSWGELAKEVGRGGLVIEGVIVVATVGVIVVVTADVDVAGI